MGLLKRFGPRRKALAFILAPLGAAIVSVLALGLFSIIVMGFRLTFKNGWMSVDPGGPQYIPAAYGGALFCITPIVTSFIAAMFLGSEKMVQSFWAGFASIVIGCVMLLLLGVEGVGCLLMAFPLVALQAVMGAGIADSLLKHARYKRDSKMFLSAAALIPIFCLADLHNPPGPTHRTISTYVLIDAPPSKIWPLVSNMSLPPPNFWLFRNGVAYPVTIKTFGAGVGASRLCRLSTGDMHEVISEWIPERKMQFKVLSTPDSMQELSPYGQIRTAHLHSNFESEYGEFDLVPQPGGKTLLIGTSWYHYKMWPAIYWNLWTDTIVHHVQLMDMEEIKRRAEAQPTGKK